MGTELAIFERIQPPANPARLASLPAWLQQRSAALGKEPQPDATSGRFRMVPVLPKEMLLDSSERAEIRRHIAELEPYARLDQTIVLREVEMSNDAAIGTMIAGLLLKGGQKLDSQSSDAASEDYFDALEDLPAWCIREAIRKWNRGESQRLDGKAHDFNWRPSPPTLRRLASNELAAVKGRILMLQKLLEAVAPREFSDEHRAMMLKRLQEVIRPAQPMNVDTSNATRAEDAA